MNLTNPLLAGTASDKTYVTSIFVAALAVVLFCEAENEVSGVDANAIDGNNIVAIVIESNITALSFFMDGMILYVNFI